MGAIAAQARFDPDCMSSGVDLQENGMAVKCNTGSNSHAYLNCGFSEGKWAWEWLLKEDRNGDECTVMNGGGALDVWVVD